MVPRLGLLTIVYVCVAWSIQDIRAQKAPAISTPTVSFDTLVQRRINNNRSADSLDAPVAYTAQQRVWIDLANQSVFLIGNARVTYKDIVLTADSIVFFWDRAEVVAQGRPDTNGVMQGLPVFSQAGNEYKAEWIAYNFRSCKGKISQIITEQGEGYLISNTVKRMPNEALYGLGNRYTTCQSDHPHFYIAANKVKVVPGKAVYTGPAQLVIADVRTPLLVPFGIFPLADERKSGVIVPEYGERTDLGFYLRNGGYYFGISDRMDLSLTGDIYSKGSWLVNTASRWVRRYRYSGSLNATFANLRTFIPEQNTYKKDGQFNLRAEWRQDPKAHPHRTVSASIAVGSSGFNQLLGDVRNNYLNNTYQSSISYRQKIPRTPIHYTVSAGHQQSTLTRLVNVQMPAFNLGVSQWYPFRRQQASGRTRWYEKIGISYTADARNQVLVADSTFFSPSTLRKSIAGMQHSLPLSLPFQAFKYVTVTPTVSLREVWSLQQFVNYWNEAEEKLVRDTVSKFLAAREYTLAVGGSTRLYGLVQLRKGPVKAIRHVVNPAISYSFRPDFSKPSLGYYYEVQVDTSGKKVTYSYFDGAVYSGPAAGTFHGLQFSLGNNLEMKVASARDTIQGIKKIRLLESLSMSSNYNFAADSFRVGIINLSGRTTLVERIAITFASTFDPYRIDSAGRRINELLLAHQAKLARLLTATAGVNASFQSARSKVSTPNKQINEMLFLSGNQYQDFSVPWNITIGYNLWLRKSKTTQGADTIIYTQTCNVSASVNLTDRWRIGGATAYDFVSRKFPSAYVELYRDMHCWEMSFLWVPFGIRQSYNFTLRVKAHILQDLRLRKSSEWYSY